jgi:lipoprotein-anchoring transpeptidase ErfK/SrfK
MLAGVGSSKAVGYVHQGRDIVLDYTDTHSKKEPKLDPLWFGFWLGLGALVMLALVAVGILLLSTAIWITPGVQALGIDLGGDTRKQASVTLERAWQEWPLRVEAAGQTWIVAPPALGLMLDTGATAQRALLEGRSFRRLEWFLRGQRQTQIAPVLWFDPSASAAYFESLRAQVDALPVDARIQRVGGRVEAVPASAGRALDVTATVSWLGEHVAQTIVEGQVNAVMVAIPPTVTDLTSLVEPINQWLAHSLAISAYDPISDEALSWPIPVDVWGEWVTLNVDVSGVGRWDWTLDPKRIAGFVAGQSAGLGADRYLNMEQSVSAIESAISDQTWQAHLRVYHTSRAHTVRLGETISSIARDYGIPYPWVQQANPDVGDALREGQTVTIPSPDVMLPLPVVEHKRIVVSIAQQQMWAYENGSLVWNWPVSTGIASSPTSPGVFQIQSHDLNAYAASWDLWMPYFMGIYRPVPTSNFMNGFHGFPTRDGTNLLWTGNLGYPVTFGCILISTSNATLLYDWAEEGVIVEIVA